MSDAKNKVIANISVDNVYRDIKQLIGVAKTRVVTQVNQTLVITYWHIGKIIKTEILQQERGGYGNTTIKRLSEKLVLDFGDGFGQRNLFRMIRFYQQFPQVEILTTVSTQLSWSHFVELLKIEDRIKREFYLNMCADAQWSVRTLRERIDGMLYERTAIAKQPEEVVQHELDLMKQSNAITPQLFLKDPYLLDFLDLKENFTEKDLENAIIAELEHFILEMGSDFAFMGRQKRIQIGGNDYYIDLLFYHRKLKRLIMIELKLGDFKPDYKGQVELYLKWLAKYEQQAEEQSPIAIILCSGKDADVVELMDLEPDNIHIAEYWLKLPPKEILKSKLQKAMIEAKLRLEFQREEGSDE